MLSFVAASFAETAVSADSASVPSEAVDSSAVFRVDEVRYHIGDAFDDSRAHTKYDRWAYDILNWVHIETREATVRKLLLFDKGDVVNLNLLLEAERFLRNQKFLSDANISVSNENGKNVVDVQTSDNWTLTIPVSFGFSGSEWTYKNMVFGIGVQESNFLGLGQKLGFYYGHDEFRNMLQVEYGDPHFLFRYNHFDFLYSYNTDGYLASWKMYVPFLSRSVNQWSYTLEGLKNKRVSYIYGSGDLPLGASKIESKSLDSLQRFNGKKTVKLVKIDDFVNDSLSFRLCRSFGGTQRKLYLGATYDYLRETANEGVVRRYKIKAQLSKNYEQIGAADNDIRLDFWTNLYLGRENHHLTFKSYMNFYLDHGKRRDFYGRVNGEYIFHPSNRFSTALSGQLDMYDDAKFGYQLTLGGSDGFVGFPTGFYAGQARVYGNLEQRWFPDVEILTLAPVVVAFGSVGETASRVMDINRKDLIYVAGLGVRLAQTKSISRLINKIDVSFPLNGARKGEAHYSITTSYSL